MIIDNIANKDMYKSFSKIFELLSKAESYTNADYPKGELQISQDSKMIFAEYETENSDNAVFEAHKKNIDVMYMVDGEEIIYVKNTNRLSKITKPYDDECDALLANFDSDYTKVLLRTGDFILLFPQDAHAPGCQTECGPQNVKKIIGKVHVE